ncbi:rhombosortase-dependent M36 family metallopeptidase [Aliikangiella sp. IMCC44359]|uniref:rhombosortase-dependent M36 family metallopeptidase n=1 Tax=Aliikangiella sp. IMCC44359 TaxID=3459125 RepID=UPI00403B1620
MNKFKLNIVSSLVTAVIASAATASVALASNGVVAKLHPVTNAQTVERSQSINGMKSHFDQQLGQKTFQWASKNQSQPDLTGVLPENRVAAAAEFYLNSLIGVSANKSGLVSTSLKHVHDTGRGARIAKFKQEINGIEIFNKEFNILMDAESQLVASSGYLLNKSTASLLNKSHSSSAPDLAFLSFGSAEDAVAHAFIAMGGDKSKLTLKKTNKSGDYQYFSASTTGAKQITGNPRAKQVYFDVNGKLKSAYYVELEIASGNSVDAEYFSFVIDSNVNKIYFKNNLMSHAEAFSYRIYADENGTPWDGPHGNVIPAANATDPDTATYLDASLISLVNGPISNDDPWLADDATITSGNNVFAYVDAIAPDGFTAGDFAADLSAPLTFDYPYKTTELENSFHNRKAAIVNLFFVNNYLHNDFYGHGFDEVSGNAQVSNYGRGGEEDDVLHAQVQDNSGMNNANMSTPADGASPRMQMYLWDSKDATNGEDYGLTVTSHTDIGLLASTRRSAFGPGQFADVNGKLVRINDGNAPETDGCEAATNGVDLTGNIAIIDRGGCAFTVKVKNAQDAGAIGAIIANNTGTVEPAPMGGSDASVTIPNMGISLNDGATIYQAMTGGDVTVSMFNDKLLKGSSWDNGIVAHEWGHYISNRLVGNSAGLINNQGRSMGEGWGDFHSLLLLSDESDIQVANNDQYQTAYSATSYVANFRSGIRRNPYSTDMTINPATFADISVSAEVHDSGEIWASMLWDSFIALVNDERYTFEQARSVMKDYLVAGYKMTPIAPTYTEARDAVLAAAYANSVEDYQLILQAFARRGMGMGAVSPARYSTDHSGVVESTETQLATFMVSDHDLDTNFEGSNYGYCTNDNILDKGETGAVSFTLTNKGTDALTNLTGQLTVLSGHDVTFANGGVVTVDSLGVFENKTLAPIEFTLNDAGTAEVLQIALSFPDIDPEIVTDAQYALSTQVNMDFVKRDPVANADEDKMETASIVNDWQEHIMAGGEQAKGTVGSDSGANVPFLSQSSGIDLGTTTLYLRNNGFSSDVAAETDDVNVGYGSNFQISFYHFYALEADWDGGVVEISINGSEWTDVTQVGGTFAIGYNTAALEENPAQALQNRPVYSGRNINGGVYGEVETISFGSALNGNNVKFRFRVSSDSNTNDFGWWIDNVKFSNITSGIFSNVVAGDSVECDNRLPVFTVADITVNERDTVGGSLNTVNLSVTATDPNDDALTYTWTQVSGPTVTLTGADSSSASFTVPAITETTALIFNIAVSDGKDTVNKQVKVTVTDVEDPAPVETKKKKGGGSMGAFSLLLLPLVWLRRKVKK